MLKKYRILFFWLGFVLLVFPSFIWFYLMMPMPGSQDLDMYELAHFCYRAWLPIAIVGFVLMLTAARFILKVKSKHLWIKKTGIIIAIVIGNTMLYAINVRFNANEMMPLPEQLIMKRSSESEVPLSTPVIGVSSGSEARAYPLDYLVYHHQVEDSLDGDNVLVTYCGMCRSGRAFIPVIDEMALTFRLVGVNHYNAIFEDEQTGSWWYQAIGECITGELEGGQMKEVYSEQVTLASWLQKHPESWIMQPEAKSVDAYRSMAAMVSFEDINPFGNKPASEWDDFSLIVGIDYNGEGKAYPWKALLRDRVINDSLGSTNVILACESDSISFHAWEGLIDGKILVMSLDSAGNGIRDAQTGSLWDWSGECVEGFYKSQQLVPLQSYQEYWHSWRNFHPNTMRWEKRFQE